MVLNTTFVFVAERDLLQCLETEVFCSSALVTTAVFRAWAAGINSGDAELLTTSLEGKLIKFGSFMKYFYFVIKAQSFSIAWAGQC